MTSKPLSEVFAAIYTSGLGQDFYSLSPEAQAQHLSAASEIVRELGAFNIYVEYSGNSIRMVHKPPTPQPTPAQKTRSRREQVRLARMKGYEGESCTDCQAMQMVRNGSCLKCMNCGSTSGCS